jgi:hypothetical protein
MIFQNGGEIYVDMLDFYMQVANRTLTDRISNST